MTVLVGGLRSVGISASGDGVWSSGGKLSNDWFTTLLDMNVEWKPAGANKYEALTGRPAHQSAPLAVLISCLIKFSIAGPCRDLCSE